MLIGHQEIKKDFERLIKNDRLGHGYLFFGPARTGKYTFAKELAIRIERGAWPAEERPRRNEPSGPGRPLTDALLVEPDEAGTIGIDAVRALKAFFLERPLVSVRRTAIVDRAETLTTEAQNALLKVAEEPPSAGLLFLVSRAPEQLLPTLLSRLQQIYFGTVPRADIAAWLSEQGIGKKEATAAAEAAAGLPGLALAIAKQELPPAAELAAAFLRTPAPGRKDFVKALVEPEDFNFRDFLDGLILVLARNPERDGRLWHAVLELRGMADATGLNPRVQLLALGQILESGIWNLESRI